MLATSYGIPETFTCAVCRQSTGKPDVAENGLLTSPVSGRLSEQKENSIHPAYKT